LKHPVTGTITDDEVIGKSCQFVNIQQDDLFSFLLFQKIYYMMRFFNWFQDSPR